MCPLTSFHCIFRQLYQISFNFLICCLNKWLDFSSFPSLFQSLSLYFPFFPTFFPINLWRTKSSLHRPPPLVAALLQWIAICIFCTLHHSVCLSWKRRYIDKWVSNLSPADIWHLLGFVSPIRKTFCYESSIQDLYRLANFS